MRSVNQNHHLYVVKSVSSNDVTEASSLGAIKAYVCGDNVMNRDLYFKYKGRDGVTRSDFIPLNQITYMKYVSASSQETPLKRVEITLSDEGKNSSDSNNAFVGQDYILNIIFREFYSPDANDTYVKTVPLHITSNNKTASAFYKAMVSALNAAFAREVGASAGSNPYLKFMIGYSSDSTSEENDANWSGATATKIIIEEKEQPYALGKGEPDSIQFDVVCSTIYTNAEEVVWGDVQTVASVNKVKNSKKMADLEWFTFSERADFYHGTSYPNDFVFTPMVDADSTDGYDALEIHFAYQGTCEDIQKSEKDITLIASAANSGALIKGIAAQIEAIAGNKVNDGQSLTQVETPVATPGAGSGLSGTVKVTLSCATPGAKIYYSTTDATPDEESTEYNGGEISLTSDTHIYAIAIKDGMVDSEILDSFYDFT